MNPMDYSLCDHTVTLYRQEAGAVKRRVVENAYLSRCDSETVEAWGKSRDKKFLLIIPGQADIRMGDRVYDGFGPREVDWKHFLPAKVEALMQVSFVKPCYWENAVCHVQAGSR